jgi:hypothetical protein
VSFSLKRDAKYPNMYRIQRSDGTLSDMSNQVRAKEALAVYLATQDRRRDSQINGRGEASWTRRLRAS